MNKDRDYLRSQKLSVSDAQTFWVCLQWSCFHSGSRCPAHLSSPWDQRSSTGPVLAHEGHWQSFFYTIKCFPKLKESSTHYSLVTPRSQALGEVCPYSECDWLFPNSQWEVIPDLPVPVINLGCDLLLELCQFIFGEGARQDLGPPLNQAVRHLLQLTEERDLVVLRWKKEAEERTKKKNGVMGDENIFCLDPL